MRKKWNYGVEGPLGIPQSDAAAKATEELLKSVPADCRELLHVQTLAKDTEIVEGERSEVSFVTTDTVDRMGEVVAPNGGDWKHFLMNPVVTMSHDYHALPLGRALWVRRGVKGDVEGWKAKTQYHTRPAQHQGEWLPDSVWHLIKGGDLKGKSIGFVPMERRDATPKEIERRPELAKVRCIISKWAALEYAVCAVPCNPDTLVQAVGKMIEGGIEVPDSLYEYLGVSYGGKTAMGGIPLPKDIGDKLYKQVAALPEIVELRLPADAKPITADDLAHEIMRSMADELLAIPDYRQPQGPTQEEVREAIIAGMKQVNVVALIDEAIDRARGRV